MTATVDLTTKRTGRVLDTSWEAIMSGPVGVGFGTEAIVTVTAAPTPGVTVELRSSAIAQATVSTVRTVTAGGTYRLGPITVNDTAGDIVQVEARRTAGTGGLHVIDAAGVQGAFTDQPGDPGGTQTGITAHPTNRTVAPGQPATFTVTAVGVNLTYQWEQSTDGGNNWSPVGSSTSSYTVTNPQAGDNGDEYRVTVSGDNNPPGGPVTSNVAVLTVSSTTATISVEPSDATVLEGATATYTVTGTNFETWDIYRRTGGTGTGSVVSSGTGPATTVQYTTPIVAVADDGAEYRFALRGTDAAVDVYSRWALLSVNAPAGAQVLLTDTKVNP